jgi:hypothetical protein
MTAGMLRLAHDAGGEKVAKKPVTARMRRCGLGVKAAENPKSMGLRKIPLPVDEKTPMDEKMTMNQRKTLRVGPKMTMD